MCIRDSFDTLYYKVQRNDDIYQISRKYNVDVSKLLYWNNILPTEKIKKGDKIIIIQYNE